MLVGAATMLFGPLCVFAPKFKIRSGKPLLFGAKEGEKQSSKFRWAAFVLFVVVLGFQV